MVAIKEVKLDANLRLEFESEVLVAHTHDHPNIVGCFGAAIVSPTDLYNRSLSRDVWCPILPPRLRSPFSACLLESRLAGVALVGLP